MPEKAGFLAHQMNRTQTNVTTLNTLRSACRASGSVQQGAAANGGFSVSVVLWPIGPAVAELESLVVT